MISHLEKPPSFFSPAACPKSRLEQGGFSCALPHLGGVTSPDAVEDVAIPGDPQQLVVRGNLVEMGPFLVSKEQVRLPDGVQHGGIQVQGVVRVLIVGQPGVIPLLPQEDVHPVILHTDTQPGLRAASEC